MGREYDIFKTINGKLIWQCAATGLKQARTAMAKLAATSSARFSIRNRGKRATVETTPNAEVIAHAQAEMGGPSRFEEFLAIYQGLQQAFDESLEEQPDNPAARNAIAKQMTDAAHNCTRASHANHSYAASNNVAATITSMKSSERNEIRKEACLNSRAQFVILLAKYRASEDRAERATLLEQLSEAVFLHARFASS